MFHLKFKHIWHLKWNRSESMHWTFSKDSLNLRKQKPILFSWPCISWNSSTMRSLKTSVHADVCPHSTIGKAAPPAKIPTPTLLKDHFPFSTSPVSIPRTAGGRTTSRLQTAATLGYPSPESRGNQQLCQHSTLLLASMGAQWPRHIWTTCSH